MRYRRIFSTLPVHGEDREGAEVEVRKCQGELRLEIGLVISRDG